MEISIFDIIFTAINTLILIAFVVLAIMVFKDSRKNGDKLSDSIFWAILALFVVPPIGALIYWVHRNKKLAKQDA